jgi:hypothetical protein
MIRALALRSPLAVRLGGATRERAERANAKSRQNSKLRENARKPIILGDFLCCKSMNKCG